MTWFRLIIRGVFRPPARAALTIALVALNGAGIFLFLIFALGINMSLEREGRFLGADLMVLNKNAEYEPEEALMVGAPTGNYIKDEILDVLKQIPEIDAFTPQLYFRSLSLGCCSMKEYPLVGFDPETDFIIVPWAGGAGGKPVGESAALAGCEAGRKVTGRKVVFFNHPFRIRNVLPCTGMAVDKTFFLPLRVAREIAGPKLDIHQNDISSVLIRLKNREQMDYVVELIEYLIDGVKVLRVPVMIREASERIRFIERLVGLSLAVTACCGMALLFVVFRLGAEVKIREAALIRALGATPWEVLRSAMGELSILALMGIIPGMGIGVLGLYLGRRALLSNLSAPFVSPGPGVIILIGLVSVSAVIGAAMLAGLIGALKLAKVDPDSALKKAR